MATGSQPAPRHMHGGVHHGHAVWGGWGWGPGGGRRQVPLLSSSQRCGRRAGGLRQRCPAGQHAAGRPRPPCTHTTLMLATALGPSSQLRPPLWQRCRHASVFYGAASRPCAPLPHLLRCPDVDPMGQVPLGHGGPGRSGRSFTQTCAPTQGLAHKSQGHHRCTRHTGLHMALLAGQPSSAGTPQFGRCMRCDSFIEGHCADPSPAVSMGPSTPVL